MWIWIVSLLVLYLLLGVLFTWALAGVAPGGHQNNWSNAWESIRALWIFIVIWPYWLIGSWVFRKRG